MAANAEWRAIMRTRDYLTASCLDTPTESVWATLYMHGSDLNFLNKTSLTRYESYTSPVDPGSWTC
ncbi:hypothetical protein PybrP1_006814 [[Pythium] brassicae (nom. inval.)]|nr:hypothetical protein PybrP1_006814 [[Pythium] brassicae (nom. inval.)]